MARRAASQAQALEGLLHHGGHLTEGSRSNLFAVKAGQLITPPQDTILSGITRDIVLKVMQHTAHPVIETTVPATPQQYDEFFITSTSMQVMPITHIDGQPVGDGRVGPITKIVMQRFCTFYDRIIAEVF